MRRIDVSETDLLRARDAAEAANRAKSVFLANMSHELRTPLNAILGFAELMVRDGNVPETQRRNLETILKSGQHLLTLINNILEIAKIEAGRLERQTVSCDLQELLEAVVEPFELRARQADLELVLSLAPAVPQRVDLDPGKLRQILINLLANAIKFTPRGKVELDVEVEQGKAGTPLLAFAVRDTGVGISADELEAIFRPFYQTEQGMRAGEGTGLGLTIARQYAELLGGSLTATSVPGRGSIFTLRLPLMVAPADAAPQQTHHVVSVADSQRRWKVLIVEDKADNQRLLELLMQRVGFETRVAGNGQEAVAAFQAWQPDFIWMDMRMPVMDGYEATRRIRALAGGQRVKITALTASAFREDRAGILAAGCDEVVAKPLVENQLFDVMARLLGVQFRYANGDAEAAATETALDLSGLPMDLRRDLVEAAARLDMEASEGAIERVRSVDAKLAEQLTSLARAYRFDRIIALNQNATGQP